MATLYDLTTQKVIGTLELPTTNIFLLGPYSWLNCDERIITIYKLDQHQKNQNCSLHQLDFLFKTKLKVTSLPIISNENAAY